MAVALISLFADQTAPLATGGKFLLFDFFFEKFELCHFIEKIAQVLNSNCSECGFNRVS